MKAAKAEIESVRSIRGSIRGSARASIRSVKSSKNITSDTDLHQSFEEWLLVACKKYACPYSIAVKKEYHQDDFYKQLKAPETPVRYKKIAISTTPFPPKSVSQVAIEKPVDDTIGTTPSEVFEDSETINLTAIYDNSNNLVEINLSKVRGVPRSLMQIIGYLAPSYEYLMKITLNACAIDSIIIYEISKTVKMSSITDICLDGSPVLEGNYFIFLDHQDTRIRYLSLCRCKVNDAVCIQIANRLHYLCPAERTLLLLNLSSNHITDAGAKCLGQALRSNRRLRYLNLADNRICDDGAGSILDSLMEFRLTSDETMNKRKRHLEYLKTKRRLVIQYLNDTDTISSDEYSRKSGVKKKKLSATSLKNKANFKKESTKKDKILIGNDCFSKAEGFASAFLGPFSDPFAPLDSKIKDGYSRSLGNMVMSYLNLSYNRLAYPSVMKVLAVLQYQKAVKRINQSGLIKVVIEGNDIPIMCAEYQNISDLNRLAKGMQPFSARLSNVSMRQKGQKPRISLVQPPSLGRN